MSRPPRDVAIVGMSALFPGAPDLATYWQNILDRVDAVREAPDEWSTPFYDPDSTANDRMYTRKGGFIGDIARFNPIEFGITPSSVDGGDPDGYLALRLARDALADAGYLDRDFDRTRAGVILGRGLYLNRGQTSLLQHGLVMEQTLALLRTLLPDLDEGALAELRASLKASLPPLAPEMASGLVPNAVTGRIANRLDLMGPNYVVDAACASSLIAVEHGMRELESGRCDLVLAGGVQTSGHQAIFIFFCLLGALSRGDVRPFDAKAGGTLIGEGVGVVALKRLADARADGDRIYAVLKGVGSSSDGRAKGVMAPRLEGEVLALRRAYERAGVSPETVGLLEAHGTGIPLGDQTEIQALTEVFGERRGALPSCALGSVKSMIGHTLPAAGAAGLIKAALALHYKVLPPTLCDEPHPALALERTPFYLNDAARPWIHGGRDAPRRAGVDAFGFGGVNAHAVLEEYRDAERPDPAPRRWPSELALLAADSRADLLARIDAVVAACEREAAPDLADLACTLAAEARGRHRLAVVAADAADLVGKLRRARERLGDGAAHEIRSRGGVFFSDRGTPDGRTAFLFPGEGAQYPNMLADLAIAFPRVRHWFDLLDRTLAGPGEPPPSAVIFPAPTCLTPGQRAEAESRLFDMNAGSESVSIANLALFDLLSAFGVRCDAMVGHSTGEFAGLVASGIAGEPDPGALIEKMRELNALTRGLDESGRVPKGALLAVGALDHDRLVETLRASGDDVHLAMDNCRNQAVVFVPEEKADALLAALKAQGAIVMSLPFDRAYHTALFAEVAAAVDRFYATLELRPATTPLYSCATTGPFPDDPEGIRRLAAGQWARPVRFRETVLRLHDEGVRTFVEVGPRNNLTSFVRETLAGRPHLALATNEERRGALAQLQRVLGQLFVEGHPIELGEMFARRAVSPVDLADADGTPAPPADLLPLDLPVMRPTGPVRLAHGPGPVPPEDRGAVPGIVSGPVPEPVPGPASEPAAAARPVTPAAPGPEAGGGARGGAVAGGDPRLAMLAGHFDLMNEFLASQARTFERFSAALSAGAGTAAPSAGGGGQPGRVPAGRHDRAGEHPLLGEVLERGPRRLVSRRRFDLVHDRVLRDHVIGITGAISDLQPDLHGLSVVPLSFNVEMAAEAAHCLCGGAHRVSAVADVRGHRWLALDRELAVVRCEAERRPGDAPVRVDVRLYDETAAGAAPAPLAFEAVVELGAAPAAAPPPLELDRASLRAPGIAPRDLYRTGMFHGPRMQGVKALSAVGAQAIEAALEVLPADDLFASSPAPRFVLDPVALDLAAQMIGYWTYETMPVGANVFPEGVARIERHVDALAPGERLTGRASISRAGADRLVADVDLLDATGRVAIRISGWCDRVFPGAEHVYRWRLAPRSAFLSEPVEAVPEAGLIVRRLSPQRCAPFLGAGDVWLKVLAHASLGRAERDAWYRLPEAGPRRAQWLFGRIAAKDAARQWARETCALELAPADLEVTVSATGKPAVRCVARPELAFPEISISHSAGHCVASIAREPGVRLGVDLQRLDDARPQHLAELAFGPDERELARSLEGPSPGAAVVGLWCAKEAAAKAAGTGLGGEPRSWVVTGRGPGADTLTVRRDDEALEVRCLFSTEEVWAICTDRPSPEEPR